MGEEAEEVVVFIRENQEEEEEEAVFISVVNSNEEEEVVVVFTRDNSALYFFQPSSSSHPYELVTGVGRSCVDGCSFVTACNCPGLSAPPVRQSVATKCWPCAHMHAPAHAASVPRYT